MSIFVIRDSIIIILEVLAFSKYFKKSLNFWCSDKERGGEGRRWRASRSTKVVSKNDK